MAKTKFSLCRKLWRWGVRLALLLLIPAGWIGVCCMRPESFKATKRPRPGRRAGDKVGIVYSTHYEINMAGAERLHPFDIHKYAKIYLELQTAGYIRPPDVTVPEPVTREQILLVHSQGFLQSLKDSKTVARYLEAGVVGLLPAALVDAGILHAFRYATGGTIEAGRLALAHGIAVNLAGGYHHANADAGEGFNVYNDLAIAIRVLQKAGRIRRACVVDLDVHQGNGTAEIFAGDPAVYTFSMHQGDIYPVPKADSDRDIELPGGTDDDAYLRTLRRALPEVLREARPDIVFLQAGCDTLADDPLAGLAMTPEGIVRRDEVVIDACVERGIPVVMTLGGGYSPGAWRAQYTSIANLLDRHALAGAPRPYPGRKPTAKERIYTNSRSSKKGR